NCMLGVDRDQVWMGSEDCVIYIISMVSMVCNRQLTEHRAEVTGLALDTEKYSQKVAYSCSAEGTVMAWEVSTLKVKKHFRLCCDFLQSVYTCGGALWCCSRTSIMEVWRNGSLKQRVNLPEHQRVRFSCALLLPEVLKELHGHVDKVTALCSAEDRYILSGAGKHDGKVAIWKVDEKGLDSSNC
ncbi:hypothetical protein GOODEAATRI_021869, partial [Goodea atripinnis]